MFAHPSYFFYNSDICEITFKKIGHGGGLNLHIKSNKSVFKEFNLN